MALCLAYLINAFADLDLEQLIASMGRGAWFVAGVCAVAYAACLGLLAQAWAAVAGIAHRLPFARAVAIYGPGTVAKYLPGSVFHYASRHVLGRRERLGHAALVKASMVEIAMHVGIALMMAAALIAAGWLAPVGGAALAAGLLAAARRLPLVASFAYQLLFFSAFAAIVLILGSIGALIENPMRLASLFFVAWTVGFLVPIAPGGIGVREAVLLALAAPYETTDAIAMLAVLVRLVGIVGDGLFGLASYFVAARLNRHASV